MQDMNRTSQWIASGFLALAEDMPLRRITVQKLCEHVHINRSTFYYHFSSIQELIHWIYHQEVNVPVLKKIHAEPKYLLKISIIALQNIYKRRGFWQKVLSLNTADEFIAFMLQDTRENWKEVINVSLAVRGIKIEDLDEGQREKLDYITEYYCSAHYHVTLMWIKQGMKMAPEKLADMIDRIAANGYFYAVSDAIGDQTGQCYDFTSLLKGETEAKDDAVIGLSD